MGGKQYPLTDSEIIKLEDIPLGIYRAILLMI